MVERSCSFDPSKPVITAFGESIYLVPGKANQCHYRLTAVLCWTFPGEVVDSCIRARFPISMSGLWIYRLPEGGLAAVVVLSRGSVPPRRQAILSFLPMASKLHFNLTVLGEVKSGLVTVMAPMLDSLPTWKRWSVASRAGRQMGRRLSFIRGRTALPAYTSSVLKAVPRIVLTQGRRIIGDPAGRTTANGSTSHRAKPEISRSGRCQPAVALRYR